MELINSVTVGSGGAASIEFTSIPATYTDLLVLVSGRSSNANINDFLTMRINNDTGSNYSWRSLLGAGSSVLSSSGSSQTYIRSGYLTAANGTSNTFGNAAISIFNYAGSTSKTVSCNTVSENNSTSDGYAYQAHHNGLWSSSSAVTSIKLYAANYDMSATYNFAQYSTAYLFGIKKGSGGATVS